jgi:hypothetical protein
MQDELISDPRFWDCECGKQFIHSRQHTVCNKCGANRDEQPDSRVDEICAKNLALWCCSTALYMDLEAEQRGEVQSEVARQKAWFEVDGELPPSAVTNVDYAEVEARAWLSDEFFEQLVEPISEEEKVATDAHFKQLYEEQAQALKSHRMDGAFHVISEFFFGSAGVIQRDGDDKILITFKDGAAMSIHMDYAG